MLSWALLFLLVALVAALLGFGGLATATVAAGLSKLAFFVFLALFLIALAAHAYRPVT